MPIFPLRVRPAKPYAGPEAGERAFRTRRKGGARLHAGCDLYAPVGTPIFAIADGEVIRGHHEFYHQTDDVQVFHPGIGVVRYGEVMKPMNYSSYQNALVDEFSKSGVQTTMPITVPKLRPGTRVAEGDLIAAVGKLIPLNRSMLHFELYQEQARGRSLKGTSKFLRCPFLLDPTKLLLDLEHGRAIGAHAGASPQPSPPAPTSPPAAASSSAPASPPAPTSPSAPSSPRVRTPTDPELSADQESRSSYKCVCCILEEHPSPQQFA